MNDNKQWAKDIQEKWMFKKETKHALTPIIVAGEFVLANTEDLKKAAETAKANIDGWRALSYEQRHKILCDVANEVRKKRRSTF